MSNFQKVVFMGIANISMIPLKTTALTNYNNTEKTTILKALQLALGRISFLTQKIYLHLKQK